MENLTLTLLPQELDAIIKILEVSDPTNFRSGGLRRKIFDQVQIQRAKKEEVKDKSKK